MPDIHRRNSIKPRAPHLPRAIASTFAAFHPLGADSARRPPPRAPAHQFPPEALTPRLGESTLHRRRSRGSSRRRAQRSRACVCTSACRAHLVMDKRYFHKKIHQCRPLQNRQNLHRLRARRGWGLPQVAGASSSRSHGRGALQMAKKLQIERDSGRLPHLSSMMVIFATRATP
jgi:hypothetical protein